MTTVRGRGVSKLPASADPHRAVAPRHTGPVAERLLTRFPARRTAPPRNTHSAGQVLATLSGPSFLLAGQESTQALGVQGARWLLDWLVTFSGTTWQQRWDASGAARWGSEWSTPVRRWLLARGIECEPVMMLDCGLAGLFSADVVRPGLEFLLSQRRTAFWREWAGPCRDRRGFARLQAGTDAAMWDSMQGRTARWYITALILVKGGGISKITVGDCVQLRIAERIVCTPGNSRHGFYMVLRDIGCFPADSPPSLHWVTRRKGQVSVEDMVDRYRVANPAVRAVFIDYLSERQPALDYSTIEDLARTLVGHFWADLEKHHPGIDSFRLDREMATAWKRRLQTRPVRRRQPDGSFAEIQVPRVQYINLLTAVRAFYLDLASWSAADPARWAYWVAPCPITPAETSSKKLERRRKARMDQRTRERLPMLPTLVRIAEQRASDAKTFVAAALAAAPGGRFSAGGQVYVRSKPWTRAGANDIPIVYDEAGRRIKLRELENRAFWAWASVEVLRHTGVRIEELLEISHHSITQYTLPSTGEIIPLLQIAPSKSDEERVLVVGPELADVLSAIVCRVRGTDGRVPLVPFYDIAERVWSEPAPLLFQWNNGAQVRPVSAGMIRTALTELLEATGVKDAAGAPLYFQPHDLRRIFTTEAIMNGMPPHIAQLLLGHKDINTTMGYKAIYPQEAIEGHRGFIARRRALRPGEEYRTPTDAEWDEFLGHFERRKLALGDCGRAYGTSCQHEHSCVRCPVLRVDPAQRHRLAEIRDNLTVRIAEAQQAGWVGEADGLAVSLAAAEDKLSQIDARIARAGTVCLSLPSFPDIAARSAVIPVRPD